MDDMTERQQSIKQSQEKLVGGCSSYISENPLRSVGFALAAGLVMSLLFGGNRRR